MRTSHIYMLLLCLWFFSEVPLMAQITVCGPEEEESPNTIQGSVFFCYGSTPRTKSNNYKTAITVGQNFVGQTEDLQHYTSLGYWSRFLLAPFKPTVSATQGDLLDRIQITWEIDALGPSAGKGFNIYRDGGYLDHVDPEIRSYSDFDAVAGRPYTYCITGVNDYGEGSPGCAIGFKNPNGVITGWIASENGSPVKDATVMLDKMQGYSAKFLDGNGGLALEDSLNPFLPASGQDWTIAFWIKTDTAGSTPGKLIGMPGLYIRSRPSINDINGVAVATTQGGTPFLAQYFDNQHFDWHHVALTFDGSSNKGRLYFDGKLKQTATMSPVLSPDELSFGERAGPGLWVGRMDEVRIYHRQLEEYDFIQVMEGTASSLTPFLTYYWKLDEGKGVKSFDIMNRNTLYFCGAEFDPDRPVVHTMGVTNDDGYYRIEGVNYGDMETYRATPSKDFYSHHALKFDRTESDYVTMPDFLMTPQATIEVWVSNATPAGFQTIISKIIGGTSEFRVVLDDTLAGLDNNINVHFNGTTRVYGTLGQGSAYRHLAFRIDSTTTGIYKIDVFKDGIKVNVPNNTFTSIAGNWSNPANPWYLGRQPGGTNYLDGLIDAVAVYDTILQDSVILRHKQKGTDPQEQGLRVFFPLDESNGNEINNAGSVYLAPGTTFGTDWSVVANYQQIEPHKFKPNARQVSLSTSNTSVDLVDFIDNSTIGVTGYVRYKNTDCFAKDVEILVNGSSYSPKIFTDSTGKFVADFDPGTSAILTPKYENHVFSPALWEINNLSTPVAGIQFNDVTTRTISGKVRGGPVDLSCNKSITWGPWPPNYPTTISCTVTVRSVDGCYERDLSINNNAGTYSFTGLPPLEEMTVAVSYHSLNEVLTAFQDQGGHTVDISKRDTTNLDFLYTAQPQVVVTSGLGQNYGCTPYHVFEQDDNATIKIRLREFYPGGFCDVDTANIKIYNGFADDEEIDTVMSNAELVYQFRVGDPNTTPPYLQNMQVVATTIDSNMTDKNFEAYVTGIFAKDNTFTTLMPEIPSLVLRDPPGDGSYSWIEKDQTICKTFELINDFGTEIGAGLTLHLGGEQLIIAAPLGIGVGEDASSLFDVGAQTNITYNRLSSTAFETCTTINSKVSTSDDDLIVGGYQGGDVYMGNAFNIVFGFGDKLTINPTTCQPVISTVLNVEPGNFATTFIYSEYHILNTIIPYLDSLANDDQASAADIAKYNESIDRWEDIIESNKDQKDTADIIKNISFDAGVEYEYAETSDTMTTESVTNLAGAEFDLSTQIGFDFAGFGFTGNLRFATATSNGGRDESNVAQGVTVGYVLADDDPLDAFSVDVGIDQVYRTPIFNLKTGQSSCPWEYPTAKREGVKLRVDGEARTDVPSNEPAVFHFTLGNISATNETWTYAFTAGPESNKFGAKIFCNGAPLNIIQWYAIPWGVSDSVTVEVYRGPIEYDYEDLEIVLYSACEDQRANDLGILPDTALHLYSAKLLDVYFIRPCSEVQINTPQQGWVLNGTQTQIPIEVSGYDTTNREFKLIRLQYRLSDGNGSWFPIGTDAESEKYNPGWNGMIPAGALLLDPHFSQFTFNVPLDWEDGLYEIRAVTICSGDATGKSGYSEVMKGRVDRKPPDLVGLPQPSDGVLNRGDEISFTFNQEVNCNKLIQATNQLDNNYGLYDYTTGDLIDSEATCVDNKIVISADFPNDDWENKVLRVELHNIEDLVANNLIYEDWEFIVDRNELGWLTDSAGITKYEDETKSTTVKIHNNASYTVDFSIQDVPNWVHVTPDAGSLVANEIREIQFTASDSLALGWPSDEITLRTEGSLNPQTMGGDEKLKFAVRTICRPPSWEVNHAIYQQTMTFVLRLQINGTFSNDPEDQIAAFIEGEVRGTAKLIQIQSLNNNWIAYMTVYGNTADAGKPITFEGFDASACLHYPLQFVAGDIVNFTSDGTQGSPNSPRTLINNGTLLSDISLNKGWNWISFNLGFPDSTINAVLNHIPLPNGDLIKDQNTFSVFNNNTWSGSMDTVGNKSLYMYQSVQPNTLKIIGTALSPASNPITITPLWNWIGYIPTFPLPVNTALASLSPAAGDIIKSQTAFAQYVGAPTNKWIGNLTTLQPLHGYLLKITNGGTLTYPSQPFTGGEHHGSRSPESLTTFWNVNAAQFEHNMTLIGFFNYDDMNATTLDMELGAFVGDELRGVGQVVYIEYLHAYMFFMTCYSNKSGEKLHFKLYESSSGEIQDLQEKMSFVPNDFVGSIENPVPFTLQTTGIGDIESDFSFNVQPNPFRDETVCRMELPKAQEVHLIITDMQGKNVFYTSFQANAGMNLYTWKGYSTNRAPLSKGIYFIRMETDQGVLTKKVVLQR